MESSREGAREYVQARLKIAATILGSSLDVPTPVRQFLDEQAFGVFVLANDGRVAFANEYSTSLSHEPEEAPSSSEEWDQRYVFEDAETGHLLADAELPSVKALLGEDTPYARIRFSDRITGRTLVIHSSTQSVYDGHGTLIGSLAVTLAEDDPVSQLRWESQYAFRELVRQSPIAVAIFDRNMNYLAFSDSWLDSYGLEEQRLLGKSHYEVFPEITAEWKALHRRTLAGETLWREADPFPRADGSVDYVRWRNTPWFDRLGSVAGMIMHTEVVTDIVEGQQLLIETNQQLARSNAALEQFAYAASHDLLEPLRMVSQFSQLLGTRYADAFDERGHRYLGFLTDGALRMQQMVADLLRYARAGDHPDVERVSLTRVFALAAENVRASIDAEGAAVRWDSAPDVLAVEAALVSVFQNLMANAIKFRAPDRTPTVELLSRVSARMVEIEVRDNGRGFPPSQTENIFRLFRRIDGASDPNGSGIGLSIVQRTVESLGGSIRAEGRPGQGASFWVELPRALKNRATAKKVDQ